MIELFNIEMFIPITRSKVKCRLKHSFQVFKTDCAFINVKIIIMLLNEIYIILKNKGNVASTQFL